MTTNVLTQDAANVLDEDTGALLLEGDLSALLVWPTITGWLSTADPFDTPAWVAMPDVVSFTITQGRSDFFDGTFQPQTAQVRWVNASRELDPKNASGSLYGYLTPQRRLRLQWNHPSLGTTNVDVAHLWATDWQQDWQGEDGYAITNGRDWLALLGDVPLPTSPYAIEVAADNPNVWFRFAETTGDRMVDSSGNQLDGYWEGNALENSTDPVIPGDGHAIGFDGADDAGRGAHTLGDTVFAAECWIQTTNTTGVILDVNITAGIGSRRQLCLEGGKLTSKANSAGKTYTTRAFNDGALHHIVYTNAAVFYVDGAVQTTASDSSTALVKSALQELAVGRSLEGDTRYGGLLGEVAIYDTVPSATRVATHYTAATTAWDLDTTGERVARVLNAAGQLAADRDIDDGRRVLGPAVLGSTATAYLQQIARTEQGGIYQTSDGLVRFRERTALLGLVSETVFTDADSEGAYKYEVLDWQPESIDQVRNAVSVTWVGGTETLNDSASVAAYGYSAQSVGTIAPSAAEARDVAACVLVRSAQPMDRVRSLVLNPAGDSRLWVPALSLAIGDRVTVQRTPLGQGAQIVFDCVIDGRTVTADRGRNVFTVELFLNPLDTTTYFTWGGVAGTGWGQGAWS